MTDAADIADRPMLMTELSLMIIIDLMGEEEEPCPKRHDKKPPGANQGVDRSLPELQVVVVPIERKREPKNPFLRP